MNKQTKGKSRGIEWTDATWNPVAGCFHACQWTMDDGSVANCYAEDQAESKRMTPFYPNGFEHHYWHPHRLDEPRRTKTPMTIFVGSMADVFGHWVPAEQIQQILDVCREADWHTFQLLTKNPVRTREFDMPSNVWIGASSPPDFMWGKALTRRMKVSMLHRTLKSLRDANATIKWMSFEPLSWDVSGVLAQYPGVLNWAVIGAASNGRTYYAPNEWDYINLEGELDYQQVPVFLKGNMTALYLAKRRWREEFPASESIPAQTDQHR